MEYFCILAIKGVSKEYFLNCLTYVYAAIEDRNADVRRAAQESILPFMIQVGYESMQRKTSKLKVR